MAKKAGNSSIRADINLKYLKTLCEDDCEQYKEDQEITDIIHDLENHFNQET